MSQGGVAEANVLQVTPFLHVEDVAETVRFFVERLGFAVLLQTSNYAYVQREGAGFRILENYVHAELGSRRILYYIDVKDVDAVAAELSPKLEDLPEHHTFGPYDQEYGQREFMVRLPDGMVLAFGQAIRERHDSNAVSSGEWSESQRS